VRTKEQFLLRALVCSSQEDARLPAKDKGSHRCQNCRPVCRASKRLAVGAVAEPNCAWFNVCLKRDSTAKALAIHSHFASPTGSDRCCGPDRFEGLSCTKTERLFDAKRVAPARSSYPRPDRLGTEQREARPDHVPLAGRKVSRLRTNEIGAGRTRVGASPSQQGLVHAMSPEGRSDG